ncbi:MAG: serpin family protein, partial [Pirellulales bacterium]|nr:serpin family protein [Pirellulales bacterium]
APMSGDAAKVTIVTPNSRIETSDANCLIGVHPPTRHNRGGLKMINPLTRMLVLSGIATLSSGMGTASATENELVAVSGQHAPVVETVEQSSQFAVDLYRQVSRDSEENVFVSPYSVSTALAMLAEGARHNTADELGQVLHFPPAARRLGDDVQSIPWETAKVYAGIAQLNEILGRSNGQAGEIDGRAELKKLAAELEVVREKMGDLMDNPPPDVQTLREAVRERSREFLEIARRRRSFERGSDEYEKLSQEMRTHGAKTNAMRSEGRKLQKSYFAPLEQQEKTLVTQFNATLRSLGGYQLDLANAIWVDRTLPLRKTYRDTVSATFKTDGVFAADFIGQAETERLRINHWIEQQTNFRIRDFLEPDAVDQFTRMVLTNAIYFAGDWKHPFDEERTRPGPFTLADGSQQQTALMNAPYFTHGLYGAINGDHTVFEAPKAYDRNDPPPLYPDEDGFQMISLPYRGDQASMIFLVPMREDGLAQLEAQLNEEALTKWLSALKPRQTHVTLPKFRLQDSFELKEPLQQLGLRSAFVPPSQPGGADFTGIADLGPGRQLYLSRVIHKTYVEVNEEGTEAAAVTSMMVPPEASVAVPELVPFIPDFRADRPFLFLIRHRQTGTILFMGRLVTPDAA